MSEFLIAIDDTDNLETLGTGHVLAHFLDELPYETGFITRHQLFVNEQVPFTSHNSAMCASVEGDVSADELIERAADFLAKACAEGSDPGLCVVDRSGAEDLGALVEWGRRAKVEVLAKADAYALAARCGVHLSEHGGDGQGVVGALAGVGLRLSGNDGRVRGAARVTADRMTVGELIASTGFDRVVAYGLGLLPDDRVIRIDDERIKAVYQDFSRTVLVEPIGSSYRPLSKQHLKSY